jgi:hypothetical protein
MWKKNGRLSPPLSFRQENQNRTIRLKKHPKPFTDEDTESIVCDGTRVVSPQILEPSDYLYGDGPCANAFTKANACAALTCIQKEIPAPYSYVLRKSTLTEPLPRNGSSSSSEQRYGAWAVTPVSFAHDQVGMNIFDGSFVVGREQRIHSARRKSGDFHSPIWAYGTRWAEFLLDEDKPGKLVAVLYEKESNLIFFSVVCGYTGTDRNLYVDQVVNYSTRKHRGLCAPFFDYLFNYIFYHPKWICNTVSLQCVMDFANQGRSFNCYMRAIGTYFPVFGIQGFYALGLAVQTKNRTNEQLAERVHKMLSGLYDTSRSPALRIPSMPSIVWYRVYDDNLILRYKSYNLEKPAYSWGPQTKSRQASSSQVTYTAPRTPSAVKSTPSKRAIQNYDTVHQVREAFQFPLLREKVRAFKTRLRAETHPVKRYKLKLEMHQELSDLLHKTKELHQQLLRGHVVDHAYSMAVGIWVRGVKHYEEVWDKIKRL